MELNSFSYARLDRLKWWMASLNLREEHNSLCSREMQILHVGDSILSVLETISDNVVAKEYPACSSAETAPEEEDSIHVAVTDRYGFISINQEIKENRDPSTEDVSRKRELKWIHMMTKYDHFKASKLLMKRCRKGIPRAIRSRAWKLLCGGDLLMSENPGFFDQLASQPGKPRNMEQIRKDLNRLFNHEMFKNPSGHGQAELFRVLKAYSIYNPVDGYRQEHGRIAAMLVMHMPAEDAFWCFVSICKRYLPGYHSKGSELFNMDWDILVHLLKKIAPTVHYHLINDQPKYRTFFVEWFMCLYTRTLPWPCVLRVWDMFLSEGVNVLYKVGLVLLKYTLSRVIKLEELDFSATYDLMRNLPQSVTDENTLISRILKLPINDMEIDRVGRKVAQLWKAGKSTTTS